MQASDVPLGPSPGMDGISTPRWGSPVVSPDWLSRRLIDPDMRIVDLRDRDAYEVGHLPGAAPLDLKELGHDDDGRENTVIPVDRFERLMSRLGISLDDTVVAYDDQWGLPSARLVWALHYYGHRNVALLDGGWDRWIAEGHPTTDDVAPDRTSTFPSAPRSDVYADYAWITGPGKSRAVLLDTRSEAEFARGHLPGALGWDWFNAVPVGSWNFARPLPELLEELEALGVRRAEEVVVYCRSGMRAAHTYVLLRHAGFERLRLYDGSWQDWSARHPTDDG